MEITGAITIAIHIKRIGSQCIFLYIGQPITILIRCCIKETHIYIHRRHSQGRRIDNHCPCFHRCIAY